MRWDKDSVAQSGRTVRGQVSVRSILWLLALDHFQSWGLGIIRDFRISEPGWPVGASVEFGVNDAKAFIPVTGSRPGALVSRTATNGCATSAKPFAKGNPNHEYDY